MVKIAKCLFVHILQVSPYRLGLFQIVKVDFSEMNSYDTIIVQGHIVKIQYIY